MGNDNSIDLNLRNIWLSWFNFKKGKRMTAELYDFQFHLEENLFKLQSDLENGMYRHGGYRKFTVCDNKKREISCAGIRDRIVHRLIYDYLVPIFDKTFIYDAWSCRKDKGLIGAIERAQEFLRKNPQACVWRADIKKFFESVNQKVLIKLIQRRISDPKALRIILEVIFSFPQRERERERERERAFIGMPIGNLTSQIFANIYLNELDRFVKHELKVKYYLRYGDDFILVCEDLEKLENLRTYVVQFLDGELRLNLNPKNDKILKPAHGLKFLGVAISPEERSLNKRNRKRIKNRISFKNVGSYYGLVNKQSLSEFRHEFKWWIYELLESEF